MLADDMRTVYALLESGDYGEHKAGLFIMKRSWPALVKLVAAAENHAEKDNLLYSGRPHELALLVTLNDLRKILEDDDADTP